LTVGQNNSILGDHSVIFGGVEFLQSGPNWNDGVVVIQLTNDYFWFNHNGAYSDPSGTGTGHEVSFNGALSPSAIATAFNTVLGQAAISGLTLVLLVRSSGLVTHRMLILAIPSVSTTR
jgi:hypothetical protein